MREGERKKETWVRCLLYMPPTGTKPGQHYNQLSRPARTSRWFLRGPVTSQEGRLSHERASPSSSPTRTQDISAGMATVAQLSAQGQVGADAPSKPASSSHHPSAVKGNTGWRGWGEKGESEGNGRHYAMLECYFYFKSHHV